jgi:hypothetical protein
MAISSLLKSKGITPDITSIASRLAVDGKPRIFSRLKQHPGHTILKLNNKILKYNRNPKLLGVTLDEKLNFGQHILNIEKKAGIEILLLYF